MPQSAGIGVRPALVAPVGERDRQGLGANEQLKVQVIDRGIGPKAVVAEPHARKALGEPLHQRPGPAVTPLRQGLGLTALTLRDQDRMPIDEGELVVEELRRDPTRACSERRYAPPLRPSFAGPMKKPAGQ